jgi:hypothetical protein
MGRVQAHCGFLTDQSIVKPPLSALIQLVKRYSLAHLFSVGWLALV